MGWHLGGPLLLCLIYLAVTLGQDNASPKIPAHLIECYRNQSIYHRANRLPMTLRNFLDLVRQVENSPTGRNLNAREIASSLTYFLRMDGIEPSPVGSSIAGDDSVLPFAPMGGEFFRHRLMLLRLLSKPNQQDYRFITENLSTKEMCNLHFMLSYSIDTLKRIDESCDKYKPELYTRGGRFRRSHKKGRKGGKHRRRREVDEKEEEDVESQVETLTPDVVEALETNNATSNKSSFTIGKQDLLAGGYSGYDGPLRGGVQRINPARKVERGMTPTAYNPRGFTPNVERSACPVQNGVILTPYGSVSMGSVVAGILAGLQPQDINPLQLGVTSAELTPSVATIRVNNLWAATLAGDLADMLLDNVGKLEDINSAVGLKGGWNNTIVPSWYLLSSDQTAYVTDPQLRGSIDGLWLGQSSKQLSDNMKLSQIIDSYYSTQGLPGTVVRACNRKTAFSDIAPDVVFSQQLEIFAIVMQKQRLSTATITDFSSLVQNSITNVKGYIQSTLDARLECSSYSSNGLQTDSSTDYSMNLAVVIDTSWPYDSIVNILSLLVEKEVVATPFTSNTTLICAKDGRTLYQGTNAITLANNLTTANLYKCAAGFDVLQSLYAVETVFRLLYQQESTTNRVSKGAFTALLLPFSSSGVLNGDTSAVRDKIHDFNTTMPDVKILVATNGPTDAFRNLVSDDSDVFSIRPPTSDDTSTIDQIYSIAYALQNVPQRLAYPQCGSYFRSGSGRGTLIDNVRVGYSKFYRLRANYFYTVTGKPKVFIRSTRSAPLSVCVSRSDPTPVDPSGESYPGQDPNNQYPPSNPQNPNGYPLSPNSPQNPNYPQNSNPYYRGNQNQNRFNGGGQRRTAWNGAYTAYGSQTASDAKCISVTSSATELELPSNPCSDYGYIFRCPPIYVSVKAAIGSTIPPVACVNDCRLPTNVEYEFGFENLSCDSGAADILSNPINILSALILALYSLL